MGDRNYKLKTRYGLSQHAYDLMLKAQDGKCAICGKEHSDEERLHVDHHYVGEKPFFHSLLCSSCNSMNAFAKHDPKILEAGIEYLKRR